MFTNTQRQRSRPSNTAEGINSRDPKLPRLEQGVSSTPIRIDFSELENSRTGRTLSTQILNTREVLVEEIGNQGKENIDPGSIRTNIIDIDKLPDSILELLAANVSEENGIATETFSMGKDTRSKIFRAAEFLLNSAGIPTVPSRQTLLEYLKTNGLWDHLDNNEREEREPIAHLPNHEFKHEA